MEFEALKDRLLANPNDPRPLNEALKNMLALEDGGQTLEEFNMLLDILFGEDEHLDTLRRSLDARMRSLKGVNEVEQAMLMAVGMRYWHELGAPDRAEAFLRKLQNAADYQESLHDFYIEFYLGRNNWRRIEEMMMNQAGLTADSPDVARVYRQLARLAGDKGETMREAQYLDKVFKTDPEDEQVIDRMIALNKASGRWHVVAGLLSKKAESCIDLERLGETNRELIRIYADEMGVEAKALNVYQTWRIKDPDNTVVANALLELLSKLRRWPNYVKLLKELAEQETTKRGKKRRLIDLAETYMEQLRNVAEAIKALEAARSLDPKDGRLIRKLKDLYRERRDFQSYIALVREELADVEDPGERLNQLIELATLADTEIRRPDVVLPLWEDVLEQDPSCAQAQDALLPLYERTKDFDKLLALLESRAMAAADAKAQAEVYERIAVTAHTRLKDPVRAAEAWQRVLALDPDHVRAFAEVRKHLINIQDWIQLEQLFDAKGMLDDFGRILESQVRKTEETGAKAQLLKSLVRLYSERLDDPGRALRPMDTLMELMPGGLDLYESMASLARAANDGKRLAQALAAMAPMVTDPSQQKEIYLELADIAQHRQLRPRDAFNHLKEAYRVDASDLELLERLTEVANRGDSVPALLDVLEDLYPSVTADEVTATRIAQVLARQAGDGNRDLERSVRFYHEVLKRRPKDSEALEALLEEARRNRDSGQQIFYLQRLVKIARGNRRLELLGQTADLQESQNDIRGAEDTIRQIITQAPNNPDWRERLERLFLREGDFEAVATTVSETIAALDSELGEKTRADAHVRLSVAQLLAGYSIQDVITPLMSALSFVPDHSDATLLLVEHLPALTENDAVLSALERSLRMQEQVDPLADILEVRANRASGDELQQRLEQLHELYTESLNDPHRAFRTIGRLLRLRPTDKALRKVLEGGAEEAGLWTHVVVLYNELSHGVSTRARRTLLLRIADIESDKLNDVDAAAHALETIVEAHPDDRKVLDRLCTLYETHQRSSDRARTMYRILPLTEGDEARSMRLVLAELLCDPLGAQTDAFDLLKETESMWPNDLDVLRTLHNTVQGLERPDDEEDILRKLAQNTEAPEKHDLLVEAGFVSLRHLENAHDALMRVREVLVDSEVHEGALSLCRNIFEEDEDMKQEAAQLLAPALRIIEDSNGLVPVLETLEEHANSPQERASYHMEMADLYLGPLESTVLGQVHLRTALEYTPGDLELRDRLIVLARELDQLSDHVDVLDRIAEIADEPILQVALVQEAATIAAEELGDLEGAMNRHAKIIKDIDGENRLSLETLLNHTEQNRSFGAFMGWVDHALEVRFEADDRRPLFFRAVEAALASNQTTQALQYLEHAEGEFTEDLAFRRIHVEAARGADDTHALTEALRSLADKTDDAEERAKSRMECAKLFAELEDAEADAIAELNAYRKEHPEDREALELLISLHKKVEAHHDLADNLKLLFSLLTPEENNRATSLALQIAQVLAHELDQTGEALVWYETVLDEAPTHQEVVPDLEAILKSGTSATEAYDLLDRAYVQLDDSESRVRIRETRAAQIEDSGPRSHLLREAAAMAEADLADPQRALTNLMEVMSVQPADADVRLRCRSLAAASGMPELLAGHLGTVADTVGEPDLISTLLKERAQILLDPIGDVDGAIAALQSGLEANPIDGACQEMLADLFDEHQRYESLAELLELRALHGADDSQKRSYLLRRADLLAGPLDDADESLMVLTGLMGPSDDADPEVVERMLALFNSGKCSEEVFPILDQVYQAKSQTEELAQLLQTRADQLESEHDKTITLRRLGALAMTELADPARAARSYGLALRLDPLDEETKTAFEAACVESEKLPLYAKTLSEVAAEMDDEMAKAEWMLQEARIRRDVLGENEQAESIYRAVMSLVPDRLDSYYALETIFEEQNRHAELAEILAGKSHLEEGDRRTAGLHQLADLQTQELGNPEGAKATLVDLLEAAPADHDAHGKLQMILSSLGDTRALAEAFRAQAEICTDTRQQVDLLVQSASHLVSLEEAEEAKSVFEDALLVAPDRLDILRPLESLVREANEIDRLVELLQQELKTPEDVTTQFQWRDQQVDVVLDTARRLAIYTELADLQSKHLDDSYGAMQSLDAAVSIEPEAWHLWQALRSLASEADQPDAEVRAIHALLGSDQLDEQQRPTLLKDLATLRTDLVPDIKEAIASWNKYLEFVPTDRAGHEACAELLERAGNHEEYAAQISRMYLTPELGYGEDARVELRLRQVDVLSNTLKRPEDAAELLEALVTELPHQEEPWHQLDRIYRAHEDPSLLASLLVRRVERVEDKADAVAVLREAATIFSTRLDDHESALAVLLDAVMKDPDDEALLEDSLTEARAAGRLDAYIGVARQTLTGMDAEERTMRTCALANIMADEANMGYEAVSMLEEAVAELDAPIPVLELLCSQLSKQENIADEARYLHQLFVAQDDTMAKIGAGRRRAMLLETHLDDLSGAIQVHEAIVGLEEGDKQALVALEELYFKMNQIPELIHTCERLTEVDVTRQAELWQRIGMLQIEELSDAKKAAEAFENVTTVEPQNLNSYRMLERAYGVLEDWDSLGDVYDRWAMAEADPEGRAGVYRKLAIVRESLEDHQGAVDAYTQALVSSAGDEESREALVRLHTGSGEYEEITYLFRDIIGRCDDQDVKVQLLERLAETHVEHLGSPEEACQALSEVLILAPNHLAAFARWNGLSPEVFQPDQRARFMEDLLEHTSETESQKEIAMQLANTLCHEVGNADRALQVISKHLSELSGDARLLDLRADALEATGREDELKLVLEERLENTGDASVISEIRYRLGRMSLRDKNNDEAQQHFEEALRNNPSHRGVLSNLAAIYLDQDLATEADPLLTLLVQEMEESDAPAEERAYAHRLAGVAAEKLLDNEQALHHLKQALSYTPEDATLLLKVGCLAHEYGDDDLAQGTLNSILEAGYALNVSDQKLVHKTLGEVCLALGDGNTARDHLLEVIALDPNDQPVIEELVELSLRYEDYEGALDDLRTLAGLRRETIERYDILLRMADIASTKLSDSDRAEGLLLEAVKVHSVGRAARVGLLKLYRSQERVMDAIRALESIAEIEEDLDQKIEFYRSASQLAEENGDHALAVAVLNQILDLDFARFEHFANIDRILTECRDWMSQEQNYKRMLERLKGSKGMDEIIFKLYTGLGEIYRSRLDDLYTAAEAFELALKVRPENPGTLEILSDLYRRMEDPVKTIDAIRRLARSNPGHAESLMELFLAGEDAADDETCTVASQVLSILQKADTRVQSYYDENIRSTMVQGAGNLDLASWKKHLIPSGPATPVGDILAIVYKVLGDSLASRGLKDVGLKETDRVDPKSKAMIASVLRRVSAILGLGDVNIYIRAEGSGIAVEPTLPPCVSIGSDMLKGKTEGQLAFLLAKHLSMLLPMNALAASHGADELEGLIQVAELCSFGKTVDGKQVTALADAAETMRLHIDPSDADRLKKLLASIADRRERGLIDQYLNNVEVTSLRAGQLVSNNLSVASEMIQGRIGTNLGNLSSGDRIRELVRWMLSQDHNEARRLIGVQHR